MVTGCVKMEVAMDIKKDKSMTLGIIQAIDKSFMEESTSTTILTEEDKAKLKEKGFKIEDYTKDDMIGYKIIKEIKNIDEVSAKEEITANLGTEELSENEYMFTIKKGIFKNTYKATLKNSDADEINNSLNSNLQDNDEINTEEDNELDEDIITDEDTINDEEIIDDSVTDDANNDLNDFDYSSLLSSMELTMKVNLPYKALINNATNIKNDGKTLTWDFMKLKDENIQFEFVMYNIPNIIITIIGIVLLLILIILLLTKNKKSNKVVSTNDNSLNKKTQNTKESNVVLKTTTKEAQEITNIAPLTPMPEPIKLDSVSDIQNISEQPQTIENQQNNQTSQYDSILKDSTDK